ncbi:MAG: MFS transporter, partial [Bradyrhizobium icense]
VADTLGLASNFYFFALLNLAGAVLVYFTIKRVQPMHAMPTVQSPFAAMLAHWRNPQLRAAFAIGFCILFAFIGTFTFVNFVLVRPPLSLGMMDLGLVYLVFAPSVVTTLFAGKAVAWFGTRPMIWAALALAAIGLVLMLSSHLADVLAGMVLVGVGTFFAQACATGFVGQAAQDNRGVASGTYLACYFLGGLAGSAVLGQVFDRFGWTACVFGIGAALAVAAVLTVRLRS